MSEDAHDPFDFLPDLQLPLEHWEGFGMRSALTLLEALPVENIDPLLVDLMVKETLTLLDQETKGMLPEDRRDGFERGMRAELLKHWKGTN